MDVKSEDTTLSITNFIASDIDRIVPQEAQKDFKQLFTKETAIFLEERGTSYTFVNSNNEIVSICGVLPIEEDGIAWAVHAESFKKHAREITRTVKMLFQNLEEEGSFKRFKGSVADGFESGHKWMKILGFTKGKFFKDRGYHEYERKV